MNYRVLERKKKADERGSLVELFREDDLDNFKGQTFLTIAKPGKTRGKHFHKRKTEWYSVIKGKAKLTIINNKTASKKEMELRGSDPKVIEIPPNNFHFIENTGKSDMMLLVYVNEVFDAKDPDTFYK